MCQEERKCIKAAPEPVYQDTPTWEEKINGLVANQPRTIFQYHNPLESGSKVNILLIINYSNFTYQPQYIMMV